MINEMVLASIFGNLKAAFAKLLIFSGLSLLFFTVERSGWLSQLKIKTANSDTISLRRRASKYVWLDERTSTGTFGNNRMLNNACVYGSYRACICRALVARSQNLFC